MARLRTFIGVDVGQPIRDRLVALQEALMISGAPVKWVEPDNLHDAVEVLTRLGRRFHRVYVGGD